MKKIARIALLLFIIAAMIGGTMLTLFANRDEARLQAAKAQKTVATTVEIQTIETRSVEYPLDAVGKTEPSAEAAIVAETPGRITALRLREGQAVEKGQVVAETDARLRSISLETAQSSLRQAERMLARLQNLKAENNATETEVEAAAYQAEQARMHVASAQRLLEDARITAPISGIVTQKNVEHGSVIQPGQMLAQLTNVATLKVAAPLPESDIVKIKTGQHVRVAFDALPGQTSTGFVENIAVKADEAGRFAVDIRVPNPGGLVRAGMSARVRFGGATVKNAVTIPKTALLSLAASPAVFVLDRDGKAVRRAVETGNSVGDSQVEVRSGLQNGDRLIIKGQDNLKEGDLPEFK